MNEILEAFVLLGVAAGIAVTIGVTTLALLEPILTEAAETIRNIIRALKGE